MKKDKISIQDKMLIFIGLSIVLLVFWAIWEAFLCCIVPQTRVRFRDFEAFQDKAKHSALSMSLPESKDKLKYYYHVEWFQYLCGFSVSLEDDDYKQMITNCIEEYKADDNALYWYGGNQTQYAQEEVLVENKVGFYEFLLYEDEELEDFYFIAIRRVEDTHEYYTCVLANDKSNRIMELSYRNTNPQYDE